MTSYDDQDRAEHVRTCRLCRALYEAMQMRDERLRARAAGRPMGPTSTRQPADGHPMGAPSLGQAISSRHPSGQQPIGRAASLPCGSQPHADRWLAEFEMAAAAPPGGPIGHAFGHGPTQMTVMEAI